MIIIGAKGFAKEVLEIFYQNDELENIVFYDDVNIDLPSKLYSQFPILKSTDEAMDFIKTTDNKFTIGIGNPILRKKLYAKFISLGGEPCSSISSKCTIGNFGNTIGEGSNIMTGTIITSDVTIGQGSLINLNCTIGHDTIIGEFVELCPNVNISGNCKIGSLTFVGTNATILPNISVGENVIIAAGSVVTKDVPNNCMIAGIPAVIKKML